MAGAVKHAQRSHKSHKGNYSDYRSFVFKASNRTNFKTEKKSFMARIASLFARKHQDK
jgi:hypothetical protein